MVVSEITSHDGVVLRVTVVNQESAAPWLAFVMPFGLPLSLAASLVEYFSAHFRIVCWESRLILSETGQQSADEQLSLQNHAHDVAQIFRELEIDQAYLIGHCSGAGVAVQFAGLYPQLVRALVLVHGEYVMRDDADCVTQFSDEVDTLLGLCTMSETQLTMVFEKVQQNRRPPSDDLPAGIDLPFTKRHYLRNYAQNYQQYKSNNFCTLASQIQHPVLVLCGEADIQTNVRSSQKLHACLRTAQLIRDPDADHYGVYRRDSATLTHIWNYLYEQEFAN